MLYPPSSLFGPRNVIDKYTTLHLAHGAGTSLGIARVKVDSATGGGLRIADALVGSIEALVVSL